MRSFRPLANMNCAAFALALAAGAALLGCKQDTTPNAASPEPAPPTDVAEVDPVARVDAGPPSETTGRDASGVRVEFDEPAGISYAAGKLYIADTNAHVIRTIDLANDNRVAMLNIVGLAPPPLPPEPDRVVDSAATPDASGDDAAEASNGDDALADDLAAPTPDAAPPAETEAAEAAAEDAAPADAAAEDPAPEDPRAAPVLAPQPPDEEDAAPATEPSDD
ncbi:MAG: hypothetical protein KDA41_02045, partial [Planctomycetales bacterium]|nr:hypothetical protein [Planctomycetales bacterium]